MNASFELLSRRNFLLKAGGLTGLLLAGESLASCAQNQTASTGPMTFATNPFTLGIASGDPTPDGVVLWTRLAPDPLNGGGMPPDKDVTVQWRVAKDEKMRELVKSGTTTAPAALGHSVHVELTGLEPARWYWYQFTVGTMESPVGRTRTAPLVTTPLSKLAFAFVSCQNWQDGFFTAYQHLAKEDLDLIVHLGDYIYEGGANADKPRKHNGPEITTLADYRNRYALYKTDPHLQAVHAAFPWIVTWDDHEVENNYAGLVRENQKPAGDFHQRRAAAYQAYYEHQPLRRSAMPKGPDLLLYRRLTFGDLASFHVLDTRQYRSNQVKNPDRRGESPRTITGAPQESWLKDGLDKSQARWNVLAQQVFMAQRDFAVGAETRFSMDAWDGYSASRDRILGYIAERKPSNPIVLTGDVHANWVADLTTNFNDPKARVLASEFVGTSISSGGNGNDTTTSAQQTVAENPHIKFHNQQRGYVRCIVTPQSWHSDYRIVPYVATPGADIKTRATFVVEANHPGVQRA